MHKRGATSVAIKSITHHSVVRCKNLLVASAVRKVIELLSVFEVQYITYVHEITPDW